MSRLFPAIFAVPVGLATLVGLLFYPPLSQMLLQWGGILAGFALLMGVINLMRVHLRRAAQEYNIYSLATVLSMLVVWLAAATNPSNLQLIFTHVLVPLETAVASLLAFVLLAASWRLWQRQRTGWMALFWFSALFVFLSGMGIPALNPILAPSRQLFDILVVAAGVRAILLGVALGSFMVALRLLLGIDQPYNK
jgi:hypothetical protein